MVDVYRALVMLCNPLYSVFVNFRVVLDSMPRDKIILTLSEMGACMNVLNFIVAIL